MKMTKAHFDKISDEIAKYPRDLKNYLIKKVDQDKRYKDRKMRIRWDIFVNACNSGFIHSLYEYLNDDQIDTALKQIFKEEDYLENVQ